MNKKIKDRKKEARKKRREIRRLRKEMFEKWKKEVNERDNYTCQLCNKNLKSNPKNCHSHHIIPRQVKEFTFDIDNGITLCFRCHKASPYSAHQNSLYFSYFFQTTFPERYKKLMASKV